ncbi:uncharacterized protein J4E78_004994 [Alternaria triticimaculans]|uniref:uncharacterized protein n=1 Tax=Alternaria triticimaculans TaxID=297637 RepID=UPI0020C4A0B8|nr:uncharacterized protein J4E78_004994 [Alternaria triticimaculans]KAI4660293.1 hypothetical protein J4E78_004994 [Alternaria triticimaculans]
MVAQCPCVVLALIPLADSAKQIVSGSYRSMVSSSTSIKVSTVKHRIGLASAILIGVNQAAKDFLIAERAAVSNLVQRLRLPGVQPTQAEQNILNSQFTDADRLQ